MTSSEQYNYNDFPIFTGTLDEMPSKPSLLVNTINQYSFCMANEDLDFKQSLQMSDVLLPDGIGIVAAEFLLHGTKINKIAGADLHHYLLEDLNKKGGRCFYLGSSDGTLEQIKKRMSNDYPGITVGTFSPPYKTEFSDEESLSMIQIINSFEPDVVFVGMTAPKQEKWAYKYKDRIKTKVICTIGAVFDFYAGTIKRPSAVWINLGLEWLGRLCNEPKRLWKRYLYYGPVFIWLILKEKARTPVPENFP